MRILGIDPGYAIMYDDLRKQSASEIVALDLPGYAIGGLSVGEPKDLMLEVLDKCVGYLPDNKPRYLMGVGTPDYLFEGVERGLDMNFSLILLRAPTDPSTKSITAILSARSVSTMNWSASFTH